jgi:hypothetical protein
MDKCSEVGGNMLRIPLLLLVVTVSQAATPVFKASFDNAEQKAKADLPKANINPCEASALAPCRLSFAWSIARTCRDCPHNDKDKQDTWSSPQAVLSRFNNSFSIKSISYTSKKSGHC